MKRLLIISAALLLLAVLAAQMTTPQSNPMKRIGRTIVNALQENDSELLEPLLLDDHGVNFIIDMTMASDEMKNVGESERDLTRSMLEAVFKIGIEEWEEQVVADFDSIRAYGRQVYDIEWESVQFISAQAALNDQEAYEYASPVKVNFRHASSEYTIWVQEMVNVDGDWRISGFNFELTSRGAPQPEFNEQSTGDDDSWDEDSTDETLADDSWEDDTSTDDDSWEEDPAADSRSKKEIDQSASDEDSWE